MTATNKKKLEKKLYIEIQKLFNENRKLPAGSP